MSEPAARSASSAMLADVWAGLQRPQKELSPKFFYDQRGSELFEEITQLEEYYPTRAERALLERRADALVARLRPATFVELGAGSAEKTRVLLDAGLRAGVLQRYVPVDVSASFLAETAARLRGEYPALEVTPLVGDLEHALAIPPRLPRPLVVLFLGSTIGNFDTPDAVALLERVHRATRPGDALLLGVDLRKDPRVIERAYNDARGVTAAFNRNVLRVLNRELGADFDPDAFDHRAFYDAARHRIEMHLVARSAQRVTLPGAGVVEIAAGESVRTEISCKYDEHDARALLERAGFALAGWEADAPPTFALAVGAR